MCIPRLIILVRKSIKSLRRNIVQCEVGIIERFVGIDESTQDKISLLLPVHNEGGTIQKTIKEFYQEIGTKIPLDIIVCEDGSTDSTKKDLLELKKRIPIKLLLGNKICNGNSRNYLKQWCINGSAN